MRSLVQRSAALGNRVTIESVAGASHFFAFYHRAGHEQMGKALTRGPTEWGWVSPESSGDVRFGVKKGQSETSDFRSRWYYCT